MASPDEVTDVDSRLLLLTNNVERLASELSKVTDELRHTNETVQAQHTESRLVREKLENIAREVWAADSSSRVKTLELQIKGLYALVGFLCLTVAGRLAPVIFSFITSGK